MMEQHVPTLGERDGPGCWSLVDLQGAVTLSETVERAVERVLWKGVSNDGSHRGGRVAPNKIHSTLLLKLDDTLKQSLFRQIVREVDPFSVSGGRFYLSHNARLSREFGVEVQTLGIEIVCAEIRTLKQTFCQRLATETGCKLQSVLDRHDPYHTNTLQDADAHISLAYVSASCATNEDLDCLRTLIDNQEVTSVGGVIDTLVTKIFIIGQDGTTSKERASVGLGAETKLTIEYRAVSVVLIERFLLAHSHQINETMTTAEVVKTIVVPLTQHVKSSLAELTSNQRSVGRCCYFVSHAWQSRFLDTINCIMLHYAKHESGTNKEHVFYWLDVLCANQHDLFAPTEIPSLLKCIHVAKGTVIVLQPWDNPVTLQRIWCLYEVLGTINQYNKLYVEIPESELARFRERIVHEFETIRETVTEIDSINAQASNPSDLALIRDLIQKTVGFVGLNTVVKDELRTWLVQAGLHELEQLAGITMDTLDKDVATKFALTSDMKTKKQILKFAHQVGFMIGQMGQLDVARNVYENVLTLSCEINGEGDEASCSVANDLAFLLLKARAPEEAESHLRKVIGPFETSINQQQENHTNTAGPQEQRKTMFGRCCFPKAPKIEKHANTAQRDHLLLMKNNLAMAVAGQHGTNGKDRYDEAKAMFEEVLQQRNQLYHGEDNIKSVATMNNLGWLMSKNNDAGCEELFRKVLVFRTKEYGAKHAGVMNATQNLAQALIARGELDEGCKMLERVCLGKVENMGLSNPSTQRAILMLLDGHMKRNRREDALPWANRIKEYGGTLIPSVSDKLLELQVINSVDVANMKPHTNTDTHTDTHTDTLTDTRSNNTATKTTHTLTTYTNSDTNSDTTTNTNTHSDTNTNTKTNTNTEMNTHANTDVNSNTNTNTNANTDINTNTEMNKGMRRGSVDLGDTPSPATADITC